MVQTSGPLVFCVSSPLPFKAPVPRSLESSGRNGHLLEPLLGGVALTCLQGGQGLEEQGEDEGYRWQEHARFRPKGQGWRGGPWGFWAWLLD